MIPVKPHLNSSPVSTRLDSFINELYVLDRLCFCTSQIPFAARVFPLTFVFSIVFSTSESASGQYSGASHETHLHGCFLSTAQRLRSDCLW